MDFWSRLIGGSNRQKQSPSTRNSPQQRLDRFKRAYNPVLQICSRPQQLNSSGPLVEQVRESLQRLSSILREELRVPAPHLCLSFSATSQIYSVVGRAASACKDERVISEAVAIFGTLIDSEIDGFVNARTFARALMRLSMRILDSGPVLVGEAVEAQLIEVLFTIAAKLRLEPEILPVWFSGRTRGEAEDIATSEKTFVGISQKDDFPLCYLFIDRIQHEGRIGDFARTGLLYVFEAASRSTDLEAWLINSDLPTLMASGLGALYSQLSRELSLRQDIQNLPLLLALSDYAQIYPDTGTESVFSKEYEAHMSTFLSDLTFWQDILDHCHSLDVRQTLLDHFQVLFLKQLLYPSLLQSSDTDGGSSVAVLTYLTTMLQTLSHVDLVRMMLNYLLALQDKPLPPSRPPSPSVMRRRSSLFETTRPKLEEDRVEPILFNLVDLVQTGLSSQNPQTTFAALKLYATMLNQHRDYAIGSLLRGSKANRKTKDRTVGALNAEMDILVGLAITIGGADGLDDSYTGACIDVRAMLETQSEHDKDIPTEMNLEGSVDMPAPNSSIGEFTVNTRDPCFSALVTLLEKFLTNSVDVNLALTEAVLGLSMCREVGLGGWLALLPEAYRHEESANLSSMHETSYASRTPAWMDDEERAAMMAVKKAHQRPHWNRSDESTVTATLRLLETQVDLLHKSFGNFDQMLAKRKAILTGHDNGHETGHDTGVISETNKNVERASSPPPRQAIHMRHGSIASSRNSSPARSGSITRGRRLDGRNHMPPLSPTSSVSSQPRSILSPTRLSAQVFRPPPPDTPGSPRSSPRRLSETPTKSDNESALLKQKIRFPLSESSNGLGVTYALGGRQVQTEVSLSHVLTNIVILQNFIVELVAVMQLRACLFEEVRFA